MPPTEVPDPSLPIDALVGRIVESYQSDPRTQHLGSTFLPSRARTIEIVELLRRVTFPGFFDEQRLTAASVHFHAGELLTRVREAAYEQVRQALRYVENRKTAGGGDACAHCDVQAAEVTDAFLERIPELRRLLSLDVQAAFDSDPAAGNTDEIVFCYPGVDAIFIHRVAHELYNLKVPLLPRIMSEYAHNETGIDIHPGAKIGERFFIDHGTGVVIGETCEIGRGVTLYQGVTLGAVSLKGGHERWHGRKRHPTIEDDVTIYGGAIILGGRTVIGRGAVIGGSVFLTQSVPAGHTVKVEPPRLSVSARPERAARDKALEGSSAVDVPGETTPLEDYMI